MIRGNLLKWCLARWCDKHRWRQDCTAAQPTRQPSPRCARRATRHSHHHEQQPEPVSVRRQRQHGQQQRPVVPRAGAAAVPVAAGLGDQQRGVRQLCLHIHLRLRRPAARLAAGRSPGDRPCLLLQPAVGGAVLAPPGRLQLPRRPGGRALGCSAVSGCSSNKKQRRRHKGRERQW